MTAPPRRAPAAPRPRPPQPQLAPAPSTWARDAVMLAAAGGLGFAVAPLLSHSTLAWPCLVAGILAAITRGVTGRRALLRSRLMDRVTEAVCPLLGLRAPNRAAVTARRWSRGWPGHPTRIDVRYAAGTPDAEPGWAAELASTASGRLPITYRVQRHDRLKCRLRLTPAPPAEDGPMTSELVARAERIILELLGPTATITGSTLNDDGTLRSLSARHAAGARLAASGYRARVERVVSTNLAGRWRARWDLEADTVEFEVRPSFPGSLWLQPTDVDEDVDVLETYDDVHVAYGVDEDGSEMLWHPARDPNLMLVGSPGTGKTVAAHTLLVQATRYGWPVWVVDGKAIEFLGFQDWPNVQIVASSIEQQIAVVHRAWEVMERRYELITNGRATENDFEPLLVFLDEYADFRGNLASWYADVKVKGDPAKPPVLQRVQSIARKGRTSRVHLVFATQRPDAEYFGGDMRDNFRMRVSMGRLSPQGAQMMWESPVIGTSIPRGCRGRATTVNEANRAVEIQTYRTPDPRKTLPGTDEQVLLDKLRPGTTRHPRLLILEPEPQPDLDGTGDTSEPVGPTYTDYAEAGWVRAEQFPHLDPVNHRARGAEGGRAAASPMSLFGLSSTAVDIRKPRRGDAPDVEDSSTPPGAPDPEPTGPDAADGDEWQGYGVVFETRPIDLEVGDLLLVDELVDQWGVVDTEPEADVDDEDCVSVTWRGDGDDAGVAVLPADVLVSSRRPTEHDS